MHSNNHWAMCIRIQRKMHYAHIAPLLANAWMNGWMNEKSSSGVCCRCCFWNAFDKLVDSLVWHSPSAGIYFLTLTWVRYCMPGEWHDSLYCYQPTYAIWAEIFHSSIRIIYLTWARLDGCVFVLRLVPSIVPLADANDSLKMDFVCTAPEQNFPVVVFVDIITK